MRPRGLIPRRFVLVAGMFLLSVLLYVDRVCISAAKEPVARDLGLGDREMGWVLSAFALGYALFQTPAGILADRYGPRRVLAAVVVFWSVFTGLTGAAVGLATLLLFRFLFGAGEAGAYPSCARAVFSWFPVGERGLVQGINFSGSRLGAAFALPLVAWMVGELGWRASFAVLALVGLLWAAVWLLWFRDDPADHRGVSEEELALILARRRGGADARGERDALSASVLCRSPDLWLLMGQYFASNFTFFFCLTWLHPYLKEKFALGALEAGYYSAVPLLAGALGHWTAGGLVDAIYRRGRWRLSRTLPAVAGFALAASGLLASALAEGPAATAASLAVAIFGADMTISPSWAACVDIGRRRSGAVSGTMNMAGNLGSFLTALAFPNLKGWSGSVIPFFCSAAGLNLLAIGAWMLVRPERALEES